MALSFPTFATASPELQPLYRSLSNQNEEIRLLTIQPAVFHSYSADIRCLLGTYSLKDITVAYQTFLSNNNFTSLHAPAALEKWTASQISPALANLEPLKRMNSTKPSSRLHRFMWGDFAALSYVWGDMNATARIYVNGHPMYVTANLERVLREFRNAGEFSGRFRLWVDALCINQRDLDERANQVQRMPEIYRAAWTVVVWLGDSTPRSTLALQFVRDLVTFKDASCERELEHSLREDPHFLGSLQWLGLHELMERPYWYRLWIIQEVVMGGARAQIRCGNFALDWATFCCGISVLQEHLWLVKDECLQEDIRSTSAQPISAWITTSLHLVYRELSRLSCSGSRKDAENPSFGRLLDLACGAQCLDPRDKVYALIGLMPTSVACLLRPDYTLPLSQVYTSAAKAFIQGLDNLDPLQEANPWGPSDCPSWVADWQKRLDHIRRSDSPIWGPTYLFPREPDNLKHVPYTASGDTKHSAVFLDDGRLQCQGFVVDAISGLSACGLGYFSWDPNSIVSPDVFNSVYGDLEATTEAVYRTLIADRDVYGQRASERHSVIRHLPSVFQHARMQFSERGWTWLADLAGYYYRWERFREANMDFRLGETCFDDLFEEEIPQDTSEYDLTEVYSCFDRSSQRRRLMTTSSGYVGWAPDNINGEAGEQTQIGDLIAIVFGCSTPLAIRMLPDRTHYQVLGEAYVQGLMDGEAMKGLETKKYQLRTFTFC
ncbi:HET-domain-containing protein [Lentithecium fluviatile CBS 122367]|uniref:HET-domain-containing protein n=1 Tax=Lentithecium fluviatile CBS 122367 TaxID=1168545 RepID=A0A6G1IC14_9PLEO|nr:HET-domain-containing protein [Lentithecium fluviatile CBS 122367]